ncbi:hypothetical protein [Burkholderia ambifaria]|jgi:hypothetical protein|uniref:hypothetical protein n=1 Tax=Burkholderia ambifaria TaxID=152480 RepID=UPI00158D7D88|nr:hypothetical protein [Burkholderia ambifaria]
MAMLAVTTVLRRSCHNCFTRALELLQLDHPMNPAGIDTSALRTMLGLIAAVWAVVPSTARLVLLQLSQGGERHTKHNIQPFG